MPGATTLATEVTNISKHGLWLFTSDGEHFSRSPSSPGFATHPWAIS
jgi:hypothetical protein